MLTDRQIETKARQYVRDYYPPDCRILSRVPYAEPDGIYFTANRRDDHPEGPYLCMGGFFVVRRTGEMWSLGCQQEDDVDYWLKFFSEGWTTGVYRLTIESVKSVTRVARLFVKHSLSYLVLEVEHGVVWRTLTDYTEEVASRRLRNLPAVCHIQGQDLREMLPELQELATCQYSEVKEFPECSWRPEDYSEEDLGPQW